MLTKPIFKVALSFLALVANAAGVQARRLEIHSHLGIVERALNLGKRASFYLLRPDGHVGLRGHVWMLLQ